MNYWANKDELRLKAQEHIDYMNECYAIETNRSVEYTEELDSCSKLTRRDPHPMQRFILDDIDTVSAIFKYSQSLMKTVALNYASFKHPGGKFIQGSSAQEESLCHESNLYNILSDPKFSEYYRYNRHNTEYGLYKHRALYTPNVVFARNGNGEESGGTVYSNIITCAAPNKGAYVRNVIRDYPALQNPFDKLQRNRDALSDRIHFVSRVADHVRTDIFITGAFGCGVFRQSPTHVAEDFVTSLQDTGIGVIVFAVPDSSSRNYLEMKEALLQRLGARLEKGIPEFYLY